MYSLRPEGPTYPIVFEDREHLPHHDDPLGIIEKISHCEVHRVLVDNGSLFGLLYISALLNIGINPKEITQQ